MKRFLTLVPALAILFLAGCSDEVVSPDSVDTENFFNSVETIEAPAVPILSFAKMSETAMVQVIHNSADNAARFVDVYVNGALALDNFKFRTATPFIELPTEVSIAIAGRNSSSVDDAIATFDYSLASGEYYVVTAAGLLGAAPGFGLFPYAPAQTGSGSDLVSLLAFHGSPDAPTVDVVARDVATLVDDISFGEYQGYVDVPADRYVLDVTLADQSATAASFKANLKGLEGGAAVVLATGTLAEARPNFGLIAVLADGTSARLYYARAH
ncbi:MAG: DUF4397 domain-containing protein [Rhodothermales bacterium]|nr:DUF4397 domain-containing protein [Rhodothermales bacterium]